MNPLAQLRPDIVTGLGGAKASRHALRVTTHIEYFQTEYGAGSMIRVTVEFIKNSYAYFSESAYVHVPSFPVTPPVLLGLEVCAARHALSQAEEKYIQARNRLLGRLKPHHPGNKKYFTNPDLLFLERC